MAHLLTTHLTHLWTEGHIIFIVPTTHTVGFYLQAIASFINAAGDPAGIKCCDFGKDKWFVDGSLVMPGDLCVYSPALTL